MGLFKPDLYRSFVAGFALGAVALFASIGDEARGQWAGQIVPAATAAVVK